MTHSVFSAFMNAVGTECVTPGMQRVRNGPGLPRMGCLNFLKGLLVTIFQLFDLNLK